MILAQQYHYPIVVLHKPPLPLGEFVDHIVYHRGINSNYPMERILPDGGIDLVIDLTEPAKALYDNSDFSKKTMFRRAWISGVQRSYLTIDSAQESWMMVVRFKPGMVQPFIGMPVNEISESVIEIDNIWGQKLDWVRTRLLEANTPDKCFAVLCSELLNLARGKLKQNQCVIYALELITRQPTAESIKALSDAIGYSQKHLIHLFHTHVGTTPKKFARIMRFQRIIQHLETHKQVNWVQLALEYGYYDQAHLISEFKEMAGISPSAYWRYRGEHVNYLPVYR